MARYHLYYLRHGRLVGSGDIEAADDNDAARIAHAEDGACSVEIWNDHERVRVLTRVQPQPKPRPY